RDVGPPDGPARVAEKNRQDRGCRRLGLSCVCSRWRHAAGRQPREEATHPVYATDSVVPIARAAQPPYPVTRCAPCARSESVVGERTSGARRRSLRAALAAPVLAHVAVTPAGGYGHCAGPRCETF